MSAVSLIVAAVSMTGCGDDDSASPANDAGPETSTPIDTGAPDPDTGAADTGVDSGPATCRPDEVKCGAVCSNTKTDANNCGACGTKCGATEVCNLGQCAATCSTGLTKCGQSCVDLASDEDNCGVCAKECGATEVCANNACSCPGGFARCGGTDGGAGGTCVDISKDPKNCGACGTTCTGTQGVCSGGSCAAGCATGLTNCSSSCVDTKSDDQNCGACGTQCLGGTTCINSVCGCAVGQKECGGACTDTFADRLNCGDCNVKCANGEVCLSGVCKVGSCFNNTASDGGVEAGVTDAGDAGDASTGQGNSSGKVDCGGQCVRLTNDANHCGGCGKACSDDVMTCNEAVCTCPAPLTNCGGVCVDLQSDPQHCGACSAVACNAGQVCSTGDCKSTCDANLTKCGASCVNTQTDNANCGGCDISCNGGQTCNAGVCACPANTTLCNGVCVDFTSDRANCGGCTTAGVVDGGTENFQCAQFKVCTNSACTCGDVRPDCDGNGTCEDLNKDNAHCGACNSPCDTAGGFTCKGGSCKQ